ncbi:hypothetical protein FIBSPDRAFT_891558 [Athelia psychrophila]|uniref:Uncharacterized protein n=1 Tax=Athelia psychrophila TaxID=1759441 RepID=A0A166JKE6_9AGAM|nr:hypothetical protein FIBSPDRAFT_891558 [Fibularhizoctonia sp. CBS 109695]
MYNDGREDRFRNGDVVPTRHSKRQHHVVAVLGARKPMHMTGWPISPVSDARFDDYASAASESQATQMYESCPTGVADDEDRTIYAGNGNDESSRPAVSAYAMVFGLRIGSFLAFGLSVWAACIPMMVYTRPDAPGRDDGMVRANRGSGR